MSDPRTTPPSAREAADTVRGILVHAAVSPDLMQEGFAALEVLVAAAERSDTAEARRQETVRLGVEAVAEWTEITKEFEALIAAAEAKAATLAERDDWLMRQLDNCIADADALVSVCLDGKGMRALRDDLRDARAALAAAGAADSTEAPA